MVKAKNLSDLLTSIRFFVAVRFSTEPIFSFLLLRWECCFDLIILPNAINYLRQSIAIAVDIAPCQSSLSVLQPLSELPLVHVVIRIDTQPQAMSLVVQPLPVVLPLRRDLLSDSLPHAYVPEAIVYVAVARSLGAVCALSVTHVIEESTVVSHLCCSLVIKSV